MPNAKIDELIRSFATQRSQKVAMIIAKTSHALEAQGEEVTPEAIWQRIKVMVEAGKLQADGNISKWRHSEVRLPSPD